MSSVHLPKFLRHESKDGHIVYYKITFGYIAVIVTIIMLLITKQYGWLW